mmetsp:Transcript_5992/g.19190  ORF Transcript_5992/g.19190 Transcript_5992/m.19190 type:complete len:200 (-) Transcript_5992:883-1482(-)
MHISAAACTLPFVPSAAFPASMAPSVSPLARQALKRTSSASQVASSLFSFATSALPSRATLAAWSRSPSVWWQVTTSRSAWDFSSGVDAEPMASVASVMASSALPMLTRALNFILTASKASLASDFALNMSPASSHVLIASCSDSFSFSEAFSRYTVAAANIAFASPASLALVRAFLKAASATEGAILTGWDSGFVAPG